MDQLNAFREQLRSHRPAVWDQLPDFALYMDQVLSYMNRQVLPYDEGEGLTASMVNNYTKHGLVPRAEGKKYNRDHLAYLTAICVLKRVMSTKDMDLLIREELTGESGLDALYAEFLESLDSALNTSADEMENYMNGDNLADAAIHFALLSYASGAVSNYFVSLLRERSGEAGTKKKGKDRD